MILVHVKRESTLPRAVEHARVAVELVLAVLDSLNIKVEVELFGQTVLLLKMICDVRLLPEEQVFADVALKFLQLLCRPLVLWLWRCHNGNNMVVLFDFHQVFLLFILCLFLNFVLLTVGFFPLLPLLDQLPLDGRAEDIVVLDQGELVGGKVLCQLPAVR